MAWNPDPIESHRTAIDDPFERAVHRVEAEERVESQVRVVATLQGALGVLSLAAGFFAFLLIAPWGLFTGDPGITALLGGIGTFVGGVLGLLGLPHLAAAWGLVRRRRWARLLGIVLGALQLVNFPLGTAVGGFSLWVLLQESTRRRFEPSPRW